jgi:glycosidase
MFMKNTTKRQSWQKTTTAILTALILALLLACQSTPTTESTPAPTNPPRRNTRVIPEFYTPKYPDEAFLTPERIDAFQNLRIYEVMVESFIDGDPAVGKGDGYGTSHHEGDLKGITQSLDYIQSMGFNALWVTPIFFTDGQTKLDATGYYIRDYFRIDPDFGTLEDARTLVQEAHKRGIYVFFDAVFGHSKKGELVPSPQGRLPVLRDDGFDNKTVFYSNREYHQESVDFFIEVATYWIKELEIDGWRLDVAYELKQGRHIFWEEIRQAIQDLSIDRAAAGKDWGTLGYMVAETWKSAAEIVSLSYGKDDNIGVYSAFDFPLRNTLVRVLATQGSDRPNAHLGSAVHLWDGFATHNILPDHAHPALMLGNHDLVRFGDLIQRAADLRYGPENPGYWKRHKLAFSFMGAYTGPIMLYYGEEIGDHVGAYAGGEDYFDKVDHTRETPAAEWGVAEDHVARSSAKIQGISHTLDANQQDLKDYVTAIIQTRQDYPALYRGERVNLEATGSLYADLKVDGDQRVLYITNLGTDAVDFSLPLEGSSATALSPQGLSASLDGINISGTLPPLSAEYFLIQ